MTNYKRGDVVLVLFPDSNLQTAKKRPALIVQADNLQTGMHQIIVGMITSNMSRANHKSRVTLRLDSADHKQTGLQLDSIIVTDNLATVQQKFIGRRLGTLPDMSKVERALPHTFGIRLAE